MNRFFTLLLAASCLTAVGQVEFPYNPDENGDGFIGVVDLQGLLSAYGTEFDNSVFLSENELAAAFDFGQLNYFQCAKSCSSLPGRWKIPSLHEAAQVLDAFPDETWAWLQSEPNVGTFSTSTATGGYGYLAMRFNKDAMGSYSGVERAKYSAQSNCQCFTSEMRKVEYDACFVGNNGPEFMDCCQEKVSQGWYPLEVNPFNYGGASISNGQAFWRWAE